MKSLGIDIGTTTISAAVIDLAANTVLTTRTVSNDSFIRTDKSWEKIQDPGKICVKVFGLADELLDEYEEIDRIGLTGQMHGIVYVDRTGECIGPLYTWQDERGVIPCFDGKSICEILSDTYGIRIYPGYGLATHLYNQKAGLVPERAVKICTIMDYIGMKMTGRKEPFMHSSNAASLGMFDVCERSFMREIIRDEGIREELLPETSDEFASLGRYRGRTVSLAIGDNQAGFLGAVDDIDHAVLLNMGTGGQVSVCSDIFFEGHGIEARPFLPGKYLLVGASLCGGRAYAMLERFFRFYSEAAGMKETDHYTVMERLMDQRMKETVREKGLRVTTTFSGTREEPMKRGKIEGIDVDNFTPGNLICGFLDGMAEELYGMYKVMVRGAELSAETLILSGNGFRKNRHLRRIAQERFGMKAVLSKCCEEAACGAARSAGAGETA
ncbi:MAG TPA: hypothetical protein H9909_13320 [Candidatus Mediterraneibacter norfolkensis]|nr:hypothetical protein [Candidatus Mediterraneibacter norfolkensis]